MLGRLLDVLNLDGELMAAGTKLFVAKEELKWNVQDAVEVFSDTFSDEKDYETEDDAFEEKEETGQFSEFFRAALDEVKRKKEQEKEITNYEEDVDKEN